MWVAIATVAGSLLQSDAASDAADSQAAGTAAAVGENKRQYDLTRADYAPYRNIGGNALRRLAALYGIADDGGAGGGIGGTAGTPGTPGTPGFYETVESGPEGATQQVWHPGTPAVPGTAGTPGSAGMPGQRYNDGLDDDIDPTKGPGYQFGLRQGQQALDRKFAASGGRVSGAALKAATEYGINYATTGFNAEYQRRQDRLNRLQALAGIGQTATGSSAAAGDAAAGRNSALYSSQGDAAGAASIARGNIWADSGNQLAALFGRQRQPEYSSRNNFGSIPYDRDAFIPMQPGGGY